MWRDFLWIGLLTSLCFFALYGLRWWRQRRAAPRARSTARPGSQWKGAFEGLTKSPARAPAPPPPPPVDEDEPRPLLSDAALEEAHQRFKSTMEQFHQITTQHRESQRKSAPLKKR